LEQYREITKYDDTDYADDYLELYKSANIEDLQFESSLNDPKEFITAYLKRRKLSKNTLPSDNVAAQDQKPTAKPFTNHNNSIPRFERTEPAVTKPCIQPTGSKFVLKTPTVQPIASVLPTPHNVQRSGQYSEEFVYI
jgi:hypothetical protein